MNITRVLAFRTEMEVMTLLMTLLLNVSLVKKKVIIKKGTTVTTITILNKTTRQSKASFFITVIKI